MNNIPDNFLNLIRNDRRGRHKIYLGYCAGVGKTCQMLKEGKRLKEHDKLDVIIGVVETHGRAETEACKGNLELVPQKRIAYRNIEITEMDVAAIIARHPQVVLVDELAHTNAPGLKNAKRYQDVEDLQEAGINVISTLNVQHLESLYEVVEKTTGTRVKERIPDWVVARADEVINVDVGVTDLRERIRSGRIYPQERIQTALGNFFQEENLHQLRELALRELAAQLDLKFRGREKNDNEENANPDQVLVCLRSRSPNAEALLRYGSRLAGRLNRNWYALYVQSSKENALKIDAATQRQLSQTLELAQQLGATVFTIKSDEIVSSIINFAHEYRVGHIVIGPSAHKLSFWDRLMGKNTFLEKLTIQNCDCKIVVTENNTC